MKVEWCHQSQGSIELWILMLEASRCVFIFFLGGVCFEITRAGIRKWRQESQGWDPCHRWECAQGVGKMLLQRTRKGEGIRTRRIASPPLHPGCPGHQKLKAWPWLVSCLFRILPKPHSLWGLYVWGHICEHTQSFMLTHWLTDFYSLLPYLTNLTYILFQPSWPQNLLFSVSIGSLTLDKSLHFSGLLIFFSTQHGEVELWGPLQYF